MLVQLATNMHSGRSPANCATEHPGFHIVSISVLFPAVAQCPAGPCNCNAEPAGWIPRWSVQLWEQSELWTQVLHRLSDPLLVCKPDPAKYSSNRSRVREVTPCSMPPIV